MKKKKYSRHYLEYLKSEHWKILREKKFQAAKYKCERCRQKKPLDGHHLIYRRPLTACTTEDIMALCRDCHSTLHDGLRKRAAVIPKVQQATIHAIDIFSGTKPLHSRTGANDIGVFSIEQFQISQRRFQKIQAAAGKSKYTLQSIRDAIEQLQKWESELISDSQ